MNEPKEWPSVVGAGAGVQQDDDVGRALFAPVQLDAGDHGGVGRHRSYEPHAPSSRGGRWPGGRVESLISGAHRQPLDILRAAHVEFVVSDLDASVAFYGDLLGMIVMQRAADAAHLRGWEESSTTA